MVVPVGLLAYILFVCVVPEPGTVLATQFLLNNYSFNEWIAGVEEQIGSRYRILDVCRKTREVKEKF